jgi:hypothetical protein
MPYQKVKQALGPKVEKKLPPAQAQLLAQIAEGLVTVSPGVSPRLYEWWLAGPDPDDRRTTKIYSRSARALVSRDLAQIGAGYAVQLTKHGKETLTQIENGEL